MTQSLDHDQAHDSTLATRYAAKAVAQIMRTARRPISMERLTTSAEIIEHTILTASLDARTNNIEHRAARHARNASNRLSMIIDPQATNPEELESNLTQTLIAAITAMTNEQTSEQRQQPQGATFVTGIVIGAVLMGGLAVAFVTFILRS